MSWRNLSLALLEKYWLQFLSKPFACVLMYHSVGDNGRFFTVTPDMFKAQMKALKESGVKVISLQKLVNQISSGNLERSVVITFDDGYADLYNEALPLLREYRFPATVFLSTGLLGKAFKELPLLSWTQVKEMSGIDFQPHGHNHQKLNLLSSNDAKKEIQLSKQAIRSKLGKKAEFLAYPSGKYSDETVRILSDLGFKAAVTVKQGFVLKNCRLLEIPRIAVDSTTPLSFFKRVIP